MSGSDDRAAKRRAEWDGEVVTAGQPKGPLYSTLSPAQRLAALTRLNERAWQAAGGGSLPPLPRSQWPGEVFEIIPGG